MLKSAWILVVGLMGILPLSAQHIVWEKVFGPQNGSFDGLGSIMALENGTFLAAGYSDFYGGYINTSSQTIDGIILMGLDANGDTLFVKRVGIYGYSGKNPTPFIGHKYGDLYWAVVDARVPFGNDSYSCPAIVEFTSSGIIIQTHILSQYQKWIVTGAIATPDYGLILSGYYNGGLTLPTQMTSIKVNFLGEVEWANKWFPPAQVRGIGNRIFQTKPNEYLITGTLGRRIGGFTFDSLGNQIDTKVFYETPSMIQFDFGEATPSANKSIVSTGQYRNASNVVTGYLGKLDSLNQLIWGGEQPGAFNDPQANSDGSIWFEYFNPTNQKVSLDKLNTDSVKLKQIPLYTAGINGSRYYQYLPIGDNQVIAVGFKNTQNFGHQFLITKIDSFGTPITSVNAPQQKPPNDFREIIAFPNPTSQSIQFKNLDRPGVLQLYNLKGQKILEKAILPEKEVHLQTLPPGTYLWHIATDNQKVYSGKLLKQ